MNQTEPKIKVVKYYLPLKKKQSRNIIEDVNPLYIIGDSWDKEILLFLVV